MTEQATQDSPAMRRMRDALSEVARSDPYHRDAAEAYELVELPASPHAVFRVDDRIRFNAALAENLSHGEAVGLLCAGLDLGRLQGIGPAAAR